MSASSAHEQPYTVRELAAHIEIESLWLEVTHGGQHAEPPLQSLVSSALRLTGADGCAVALPERAAGGQIRCQASAGSAPPVGASLDISKGLSGHCVRMGAAMVCDDTAADARVDPEACRALNLKSALIVPVKDGSGVIGVVEVFASRPAAFDAEHVRIMEQIAEVAAAAHTSFAGVDRVSAPTRPERTELAAWPSELPAALQPATNVDPDIESLVARIRREVLPAADADEPPSNINEKRRATRIVLISAAAVGALAIALGLYSAMRTARPSVVSPNPPATSTAASEEPPSPSEMSKATAKKSGSKRSASAVRRGYAAPSSKSEDIHLADSSNNDASAVVLPPSSPSAGNVVDEVSPPALNVSHSPVEISEVVPKTVFPTLNSPAPVKATPNAAIHAHVDPPRLLRKTSPIYPPTALASHISGTVVLQAKIGANGHVEGVDILRGSGLFAFAATNAVRQWKYQPAQVDGRPVKSDVVITVNFSPN